MPTRKVRAENDIVDVGGIEIPTALLLHQEAGEPTRKGITLINERVTTTLVNDDNVPVVYNIAVFISREPLNGQEQAKIDVYAAGVDGRKQAKEDAADKARRRDMDQMYSLGRQAGTAVLEQLGAIAPALDALEKIRPSGK